MGRATRFAMVVSFLLGAMIPSPATAACPRTGEGTSFADVAQDASRAVVGIVTAASDGYATELRVEEILRGDSSTIVDVSMLSVRGEAPGTCLVGPAVAGDIGDRLAMAFDGHPEDDSRGLAAVALLDTIDAGPTPTGMDRLTTAQVRLLLGHEANGSTVAVPDRDQPTPDLLESLLRSLSGGFFDTAMDPLDPTPAPEAEAASDVRPDE